MTKNNLATLSTKEKTAARQLSDQIYPILRDAESSSFLVSELLDDFFGDQPKDSEQMALLALQFNHAQKQFNILVDYTAAVRDALRELDAAASEVGPT